MLRKFLADESGATAIEYALIATLVSVGIIASLISMGNGMTNLFGETSPIVNSLTSAGS